MTLLAHCARSATIGLLLLAAGCVVNQGLPPGSTERARFQTAAGQPGMIMQSVSGDVYYLYLPNTNWVALQLNTLTGMHDLSVAGAATIGAETVLLMRGEAPDCPVRYKLIVLHLPEVRSTRFLRCDENFRLIPQQGGGSVVIYNGKSRPPRYYAYSNGQLSGPVSQVASVERRAAEPAHHAAPPKSGEPAAVNLDDLPAPPASTAVDLDK